MSIYFFLTVWFVKFQWKAFGLHSLLAPRNLYYLVQQLMLSGQAAINELTYNYSNRKVPKNTQIAQMCQEFKSYKYQSKLQPWIFVD